MSYYNDAGEPLMDAAAAWLEAELDALSAYESRWDDYDLYDEYDYPDDDQGYPDEA